jgi:transposase
MPRAYLSEIQKWQAIGCINGGQSICQTARQFNKSKSVISRLWNKYRQTGNVKIRTGRGPKCKTTARDDRNLVLLSLRNRFKPASKINSEFRAATGIRICDRTARNRLKAAGLKSRRPVVGVRMTAEHRRLRRAWATQHQARQLRHWRYTMFSDESRFNLDFADGRIRVWRRLHERHYHCTIKQHDSFGGGSVMVWGGITYDHRTDLVRLDGRVTGVRYRDEVLRPVVVPFRRRVGVNFEFQQDNARPHTSRVSRDFLTQNNIRVLPWPSKSPDLNPIEHLWDVLGRRVRSRDAPPQTVDAMFEALQEEWRAIPRAEIRKLIQSVPRRCEEVIRKQGGHTRY